MSERAGVAFPLPAGPWTWHNPVRLHVGRGVRRGLAHELAGKRALVVTTERGRRELSGDEHLGDWAAADEHVWASPVRPNPGLADLQAEIDRLRGADIDVVVAYGGGSAIDSAKVFTVALAPGVDRSLAELLEDPAGQRDATPRPLYAVPTTAGTGSEVTPTSTVWDHERRKKHSLSGPAVAPAVAYVDAALTDTVPDEVTLATGLDAINQAAESVWNRHATPVTLELAARALQLGFDGLPALLEHRGDPAAARDAMAECSVLAGLAISHTRTALCHSMSYPVTAHFGVAHGLACAFTMPAVLRLNLGADDGRFGVLARRLLGDPTSTDALVGAFDHLHERLDVRDRVRARVLDVAALHALASEMHTPGRADNNLADVGIDELHAVLDEAWSGAAQR